MLGWQFQKNHIRPLPHRVWRVRLAIQQLLRTGRCSGTQLEKVVGHAAFIPLVSLLSIFGDTYTSILRHRLAAHRLWGSVRRELRIFADVLPLVWKDLSMQWDDQVTSVDASTWGLGTTVATFTTLEVVEMGQFSERWRFEHPDVRPSSGCPSLLCPRSLELGSGQTTSPSLERRLVRCRFGGGRTKMLFFNQLLFQRSTGCGRLQVGTSGNVKRECLFLKPDELLCTQ